MQQHHKSVSVLNALQLLLKVLFLLLLVLQMFLLQVSQIRTFNKLDKEHKLFAMDVDMDVNLFHS